MSQKGMLAPRSIALSCCFWIGAIVAGIAETVANHYSNSSSLIEVISQNYQELAVRLAAYGLLFALSMFLLRGHAWARWTLLVIFGGLGTFSLIFEPVQWLLDGGSIWQFVVIDHGLAHVAPISRMVHLVFVWGGVVSMFWPNASRYLVNKRTRLAIG